MAVEAARGARAMAGDARIDTLALASTSLPFADRDGAALVAGALDLPEQLETLSITSSLRAGTSALANAARRADAQTLVIASDARSTRPGSAQEKLYGSGAAALLVGRTAGRPLATILAIEQIAADFVDHYRASDSSFDYGFEERWIRDEGYAKLVTGTIAAALKKAGVAAADARHLAMPGQPDVLKRVMQAAQLSNAKTSDTLRAACGDAGAAQPLLLLADVLERAQPGELILLIGFGQGVDALVLRAESTAAKDEAGSLSATLARGIDEPSYVRYLSHAALLNVDFGMRAERDNRTAQSVAWRKHRALSAFVGGRCEKCSTVQFPPSRVCVNPDCRATDTQRDYPLSQSTGRVKTFTEDWQAYSPRPPNVYGNIEFAEGGNLLMEITDGEPGALAVGDSVRFVFRVKDVDRQRNFRRYFWKAAKE
jgi:3-hydroxy-3-methylglutaryl CoA synthase